MKVNREVNNFTTIVSIQAVEEGLSKDDSARIAAAAWEERRVWTKFSMSMFIGYFGFGGSLNFDAADDPSELPAWLLAKFGGTLGRDGFLSSCLTQI